MKPGFALSLSFEGISLLHRAAGGWRSVGEVGLESTDLAGDLAVLRAQALSLDPQGVSCKLIIPNDQVRYLSVETGSFNGDAHRAMVLNALEGATPYPVEELAFDTSRDGTRTHIAAVARETLAEAEAFAVEHNFDPVSFVAVPAGEDGFLGEPFFGPTAHAGKLPGSAEVEPDGIAVVVIGPADLSQQASATVPLATPQQDPDSGPDSGPENSGPENSGPQPDPAPPTISFSSRRKAGDKPRPAPALGGASRKAPAPTSAPVLAGPDPETDAQAPRFEPGAADMGGEPEPAQEPAIARDDEPDFVSVTDPSLPVPDIPDPEPSPAPADASGLGGFLSRRIRPDRRVQASHPTPDDRPEPAAPVAAHYSAGNQLATPEDEAARMTVFGARGMAKVGGKPRYLGVTLMAVLLLFLTLVAAWAAFFLEDGVAGLFRSEPDRTQLVGVPDTPTIRMPDRVVPAPQIDPAAALAPASPPEPTPSGDTSPDTPTTLALLPPDAGTTPLLPDAPRSTPQTLPPITSPAQPLHPAQPDGLTDTDAAVLDALRLPDTPDAPDTPAAPALSQPGPLDPVAADARYAATGIWHQAPQVPDTPAIIGLDDLYVASIDRTDLGQDAVALPPANSFATDQPPGALSSPAAAGTAFDLDARGLVRATVEGTLNPDGVVIYLGRPPQVPPAIPTRFATEPDEQVLVDRLAGLRPRLRPGDLNEQFQRSQLGGLTRDELSGVRPKLRPRTIKQEAEQDQTPTAQAVSASRNPKARPRNFSATVAAAVRAPVAAGRENTNTDQQVASVAPRTVTPRIPSSSSVARHATLNNAINLRRVNLIGVYGTPSNRRALVRLPSGRYKKVKVGDAVDGGRVVAIGDSELRYQKGGRNLTLKIPSG